MKWIKPYQWRRIKVSVLFLLSSSLFFFEINVKRAQARFCRDLPTVALLLPKGITKHCINYPSARFKSPTARDLVNTVNVCLDQVMVCFVYKIPTETNGKKPGSKNHLFQNYTFSILLINDDTNGFFFMHVLRNHYNVNGEHRPHHQWKIT